MRVLMVHNFYQIAGGEDSVVRAECAMLEQAGAEVMLFSVTNDVIKGRLRQAAAGLQVIYNPLARRALARKLAESAPDVVHIHNFFPLLSPAIFDACREAGIPSVLTLHNFRILCPTAFLGAEDANRERSLRQSCWWTVPKKVYRNSAAATLAVAAMVEYHKRAGTWSRKVDRFIALTNWARQTFIKGGLPAERISVKPNWVPQPPRAARVERQGVLFVGRLDDQKGIPILLEAWAHLDYPLRIIGDGPLSDMVRQTGNPRICYLGRQPREVVQREMLSACLLVLPSMGYEMFPLTVLEAFAAGLPVICSALPSLRDIVEDGVTGLTFAPGLPGALVEKVRYVLSDPSRLDAMGSRARALYEARYTPEANAR
ncbi:MAG TPA: glycosyltransferase family 4 protein, partial [Rhodopila sp.]|nr:glycosyltransferase family 4 protein [Rhodopila sp.]